MENSDKGQLPYNDFIKCAMNNILMENMIDWDKVIEEERHEIRTH